MQWKNFFHSDAIDDFPNRDRATNARTARGLDNESLKNLNALFVAFFDALMDFHGLTGTKARKFFRSRFRVEFLKCYRWHRKKKKNTIVLLPQSHAAIYLRLPHSFGRAGDCLQTCHYTPTGRESHWQKAL